MSGGAEKKVTIVVQGPWALKIIDNSTELLGGSARAWDCGGLLIEGCEARWMLLQGVLTTVVQQPRRTAVTAVTRSWRVRKGCGHGLMAAEGYGGLCGGLCRWC